MSTTRLDAAYAACERITREQAANFYYGIRLLSGERRRAMCAVYAFARRADDIGDGPLPTAEKLVRLREQSRSLAQLAAGEDPGSGDQVMAALADASARFSLPLGALEDLIEGVRMDVEGISYETFEQLVPYCRRVAGAIGRVCLAIFGLAAGVEAERAASAPALADDLGVALQLTNILRDVREDAAAGRVYLPREDLRSFGLPVAEGPEGAALLLAAIESGPGEELIGLVGFQAARARGWYERGLELTSVLDRRSSACVLAMAGIYRRLLERIDADPAAALTRRASLPVHEKAWVAVRGMAGIAA